MKKKVHQNILLFQRFSEKETIKKLYKYVQVLLKANICWWKNVLVFVEKYFGLLSNDIITINYPFKLNQDLTKQKHKPINVGTINVTLNGRADSQQGLMFKKKFGGYKNGG